MALSPGDRLGCTRSSAPLRLRGWARSIAPGTRKLHRDVAIKVLPELFALDADRPTDELRARMTTRNAGR